MVLMRAILVTCLLVQVPEYAYAKEFRSIRQTMNAGKKPDFWLAMRCSGMYAAVADLTNRIAPDATPQFRKEAKETHRNLTTTAEGLRQAIARTRAEQNGGKASRYLPEVSKQIGLEKRDYLRRIENHRIDQDPLLQDDLKSCGRYVDSLF